MYVPVLLRWIFVSVSLAFSMPAARADVLDDGLEYTLAMLGDSFEPGEAAAFGELLPALPDGVSAATVAQMLYIRRHYARAAWFFGTQARAVPTDAPALNNFSAMLIETLEDAPDRLPAKLRKVAYLASQRAVQLAPANAAFLNNFANAARLMGLPQDAVAAAREAVRLAPNEPLYLSNLARALEAAGNSTAAAEALARARALGPNTMAVLTALRDLPDSQPYQQAMQRACNVDFRCLEICPKSIIGGLMSVTCEIENSSAQQACAQGMPYPTSYDCKEDLPEYGILIPGLNSGFSVAVPGFSMHVLVDGQGNVDVRVEAGLSAGPLGGYVRADGHYSPTNGTSFDNIGGGVRVSLINKGAAAGLASALGHPPAHIEVESVGGNPAQINLEAYNAGIISY